MWTRCHAGHRHWGRHGAAGLLLRHDDAGTLRYLLQHRAPVVHHGGTWGIPGGAIEPGERPIEAARREAWEELGWLPGDLTTAATHIDDHGGWAYHTLIQDSPSMFTARGANFETGRHGFRWATAREAAQLRLHPGLATSWALLT